MCDPTAFWTGEEEAYLVLALAIAKGTCPHPPDDVYLFDGREVCGMCDHFLDEA